MKLLLAQINPTVNRIGSNLEKIKEVVNEAQNDTLIVFPEMVVTGYPLEDLSLDRGVQDDSERAVQELSEYMSTLQGTGKTVVLGHLGSPVDDETLPSNSVSIITPEGIVTTNSKIALPTYGVFDESRLFAPGKDIAMFEHDGQKVGVLICEDAWNKSKGAIAQLRGRDLDMVVIINGSPYETGKIMRRYEVVKDVLDTSGIPLAAYVNLVGGQDDLVFDGHSFLMNSDGEIVSMDPFVEEVRTFDTVNISEWEVPVTPSHDQQVKNDYDAIVLGLRDYIRKNGMRSVVLGVSGGIDSALVAVMAADAIGGENVYGISMPSAFSSEGSVTDAEQLMKNIGGHYRQVPIRGLFDEFMGAVPLDGIAEENLQARLRGVILMGVSNQEGHLTLAPGNKSEIAVGYSTIYGDSVGGFAPIKDVYKTKVYDMARVRNSEFFADAPIPEASITKVPSAELREGQVDQESLPEYEVLDALLTDLIENRMPVSELAAKHGEDITWDITKKVNRAEWKRRQYAVGPKISRRSFGRERFVPITR